MKLPAEVICIRSACRTALHVHKFLQSTPCLKLTTVCWWSELENFAQNLGVRISEDITRRDDLALNITPMALYTCCGGTQYPLGLL